LRQAEPHLPNPPRGQKNKNKNISNVSPRQKLGYFNIKWSFLLESFASHTQNTLTLSTVSLKVLEEISLSSHTEVSEVSRSWKKPVS